MVINGHVNNLFFVLDVGQENKMWVFSWVLGWMFQSWSVCYVLFLMCDIVDISFCVGKPFIIKVQFPKEVYF